MLAKSRDFFHFGARSENSHVFRIYLEGCHAQTALLSPHALHAPRFHFYAYSVARHSPFLTGRWPLLPLADWQKGDVPVAVVTRGKRGLEVEIE